MVPRRGLETHRESDGGGEGLRGAGARRRPHPPRCFSAKKVFVLKNTSSTTPVGPWRCFAMWSSISLHVGLLRLAVLALLVPGAVQEHDDVGVLLDGARLAKVREHRGLALALLDAAVEL